MSVRSTGCVKWFNNKSGYGFITVLDGGKDIFVHYSALKVVKDQYRYLVQGEYVEFDMSKSIGSKHEYKAENISGIKGGNLMCESQIKMDEGKKTPRRKTSKREPTKIDEKSVEN